MSANRHYAYRGLRPGTRLRSAARRFRHPRSFATSHTTWYVIGSGSTRAVIKVTRGVVAEVGIADGRSFQTLVGARRALAGL